MSTLPAGPELDLLCEKAMGREHSAIMRCESCGSESRMRARDTGGWRCGDERCRARMEIVRIEATINWSSNRMYVGEMMEWLRKAYATYVDDWGETRNRALSVFCDEDDVYVGPCDEGELMEPEGEAETLPHALALAIVAISSRPAPAPEKE